MRRIVNKLYIFYFLVFGLFFWAIVKNIKVIDEPSDGELKSRNNLKDSNLHSIIANKLDSLEGEIASQKEYSNILLNKIKAKFESENNGQLVGDHLNNQLDNNLAEEENDEARLEKLNALKKELAINDHQGEIKSDGEGHQRVETNAKEEKDNYVDGVIGDKDKDKISEPEPVIAVLVFVCNRPTINRCLDSLFKHRPSAERFPIVVSQDCGSHPATTSVLKSYGDQFTHIMQPDLSEIAVPPKEKKLKGYYNIARHYGWALNYTFNVLKYSNVLIVEDDLEISPDFFEYFYATLPILRKDSSLWCVSAWNDNGKPKRIDNSAPELLHRTDFFPGLGWMLTKEIWTELSVKWPRSYWDDWMREPAQRKERSCIRPEISRSSTFGKNGVSHGTYFQNHLRYIKLNDHFVPFTTMDMSYLLKDKYDVDFVRKVYSSHLVNSIEELIRLTTDSDSKTEYRLTYRTKIEFRGFAKRLELMDDFRGGVPRTAYRGVVPFMFNDKRVYLAPGANWQNYRPN